MQNLYNISDHTPIYICAKNGIPLGMPYLFPPGIGLTFYLVRRKRSAKVDKYRVTYLSNVLPGHYDVHRVDNSSMSGSGDI